MTGIFAIQPINGIVRVPLPYKLLYLVIQTARCNRFPKAGTKFAGGLLVSFWKKAHKKMAAYLAPEQVPQV